MRSYGISGLQAYIRNHVKLAKRFETLVKKDSRFEVCNDVVVREYFFNIIHRIRYIYASHSHHHIYILYSLQLGLVCFRAKGSDKLNQKLLSTINDSGKIHMIPARVNQRYTIRFALSAPNATARDVGKLFLLVFNFTFVFLGSLLKTFNLQISLNKIFFGNCISLIIV